MNINQAIGRAIREIRLREGFSQEDLAEVSGRTYIGKIENGHKNITVKKLEQISDYLGFRPHEVLCLAFLYLNPDISVKNVTDEQKRKLSNFIASIDPPENSDK